MVGGGDGRVEVLFWVGSSVSDGGDGEMERGTDRICRSM